MKKRKVTLLCMILIVAISVPMVASATECLISRSELKLTNGTAGEQITEVSNGTVNRNFKNVQEYGENVPVVSMAAVMNGVTGSAFYWSQEPYKNSDGIFEQVAVLKADATHSWSEDTAIVLKMEDLLGEAAQIQIEMGASPEGPRDYKMEYSLDGENYYPLGAQENKASITEAYSVSTIFEENIWNLREQRSYDTVVIKDDVYEDFNWNLDVYQDIYFKISVSSNYKVNGEKGLYGSGKGEMAIRSIKLYEYGITEDDPPSTPYNLKAYKTDENAITLNWSQDDVGEGYEIFLKKGNGSYQKVETVTDSAIKGCKLTGLSSKATYKIKIRCYDKLEGKKRYTPFTKPITVNMKKQPLLKNLRVNKTLTLKVGKSKKLAVKLTNGTSKSFIKSIKYSVKNSKIAAVKSGTVKGKKTGSTQVKTKVTLKSGLKKTFTTKIKVKK